MSVGANAPDSLRIRDSKPLIVSVSMHRYGLLRQQENLLANPVRQSHLQAVLLRVTGDNERSASNLFVPASLEFSCHSPRPSCV